MISLYPYNDLGYPGVPYFWVKVDPTSADPDAGTVIPLMGPPIVIPPEPPEPEPPIPPVVQTYVLTAARGIYSVTGQDVTLNAPRPKIMTANRGTYAVTGQSIGFVFKRRMVAVQGNYTYSGQTVFIARGRKLTAAQGSYTLTGQDVALTFNVPLLDSAGNPIVDSAGNPIHVKP